MNQSTSRNPQFTDEEAADRLAFAEAALGAAGHEVTDPYLRELLAQHARGEISGDQARELGRKHISGN
ncbi:hypothetical protein [Jonesia quinghaiensis]|uniref:hypothetical protein n=1 Tax=Jonesia quinghaiensis TaxID=262806 RepID=UPI00040A2D71|nr:hypothetical protein [Jonesia quinghaiensis]